MPYTDRMDYCAAMGNTLGFALAVEKLTAIEVSPYVDTVRVIMAELQRIASHAVAVGTYTMDIGAFTPFLHLLRDREKILDLFEWTCGARLLYNYNWVGGVSHDLPDGFVRATRDLLREFDSVTFPELLDLIIHNRIFVKRIAEVGVCSPELAISHDLTGPNLRGSGVARDLRKDDALLRLRELRLRGAAWARASTGRSAPASTATGCAWSRCGRARRSSTRRSTASRRWRRRTSTRRCRSGSSRPKGEVYFRSEAPRGQLGYYVVSDGNVNPYRVKVKSPCFTAMSVFHHLARGMMIADIIALIGSLDIVLGEIDR